MENNSGNQTPPSASENLSPSEGNTVITGIRSVFEALKQGQSIEKLFVKNGITSEILREITNMARDKDIDVQYVPIEKLNRMCRGNHQGVVAFASVVTYHEIESILPALKELGKTPFILVLDGITDVRNFGAICRTAECAGVDCIVVPTKGGAMIGEGAMKSAAGALSHLIICRSHSLRQTYRFLKMEGVSIIGASEKCTSTYFNANFNKPLAFVLGSEDKGLSPDSLAACDQLVKIPIMGAIDSLNVSVAAGVLMYEVVKQRLTEIE